MIYTFEDYLLDTDRRELRRRDGLVSIEPQVFDLLHHLISQCDRVVSKDELIAKVWGGRIVSDSAITSRITAVRQAIGDSGEAQRLIRTIPRKGLRFVGQVQEEQSLPELGAEEQSAPPNGGEGTSPKRQLGASADYAPTLADEIRADALPPTILPSFWAIRAWKRVGTLVKLRPRGAASWLLAMATLLVAAGLGFVSLMGPSALTPFSPTAVQKPAIRAHSFGAIIEVPRFSSGAGSTPALSALAERITDDLANYLSRVHWLQVIARHAASPRDSGAQPTARYILSGSVREEDDVLRLNVTLIDAPSGLEVWSDHFVEIRSEWSTLQDDVLRRVTYAVYIEALRRGDGEPLDLAKEPTLQQLFARGWAAILAGSDSPLFDEAKPAFSEALRREPNASGPMIGLAAYYVLAVAQLKIRREPHLAEAEDLLRGALAKEPRHHSAHFYLGVLHSLQGNIPAALQSFDQAIEINPSFPPGYARRGRVLIMLQRYQEALDSIRYALRVNGVTTVAGWHLWAGLAELELGHDNEARQSLQRAVAALPQNLNVRASLAALHALSGEWVEARRHVATLRNRTPQLSDQQRLFQFNAGPNGKPLPNRLGDGLRLALEAHPESQ